MLFTGGGRRRCDSASLWRVSSGEWDDTLGGNPDLAVRFLGDFLEEFLGAMFAQYPRMIAGGDHPLHFGRKSALSKGTKLWISVSTNLKSISDSTSCDEAEKPSASSRRCFDLLVYLVRHRDRIVSKDELIEAIWQGRVISEAALSSCVSAARRAIGDSGEDQRLIRTIQARLPLCRRDRRRYAAANLPADGEPSAPGSRCRRSRGRADRNRRRRAAALPDKPSIAILPFQNISGDPEQEYFADGLTEDIITGLSRQRWFFVIARNSTFAFKGEAVDVRKVASQLGVRYVLEGSVRKAADRVRVTGQLIDAVHGVHLWADRYDRELANIFELQDDITNRVIGSVGPQILAAEAARIRRKPPQSIDAWDLVMQALPHMWRVSADEQRRAQELLQQAIALDHEYAHAHALLGWTYVSLFNLDARAPISEFTDKALEFRREERWRSTTRSPWGHLVLGLGHARRRRPEPAVSHLSKSIELNPNFALGYAGLGYALGLRRRAGARSCNRWSRRSGSARAIPSSRSMLRRCGTWRCLRSVPTRRR